MDNFDELLETLKQHLLDSSSQNWLFGAGISYDAKIPLMFPLTDRVVEIITDSENEKDKNIVASLQTALNEGCHVEHFLSHLGDLIALAERSRTKTAHLNGNDFTHIELDHCYGEIVRAIGTTVRYGYENENNIGNAEKPIVNIVAHEKFVNAIYKKKANLERRSSVTFFTTNYDTLLEDALALNKIKVLDGFSGGSVAFWNQQHEFNHAKETALCCDLYKLHGSVDWHRDKDHGLMRVRYGTNYLADASDIMIYPQATKYVETQKDPFATLFAAFRSKLNCGSQNVLITCGYSFGDEHINSEIEMCMRHPHNKTTIVAFTDEKPEQGITINPTLDKWLSTPEIGERLFVAGKKGIYNNSLQPSAPEDKDSFFWWTFSGLTNFIETGEI